MNALVTGATGFAGRWLCRLLVESGHAVEGWTRLTPPAPSRGVHYKQIDVTHQQRVRSAIEQFLPDVIFHLAAMTHVGDCESNPGMAKQVNCDASLHIFDSMPPHCRGVFVSTCHVYGEPKYLPIDEHHPVHATSVYAASKLDAENEIRSAKQNVVIARAFHHTGPGQAPTYAIADWVEQAKKGHSVLRVGNVHVTRDYMDVRDAVSAYALLAEKGISGEIYNVCTGDERSLESIALSLTERYNMALSITPKRQRVGDVARMYGSADKLRSLGWLPHIPLEQTLLDMLRGSPIRPECP